MTTWRSGDPLDLLADGIAITLATVVVIIWDLSKQNK
jgi:hypothetical protein